LAREEPRSAHGRRGSSNRTTNARRVGNMVGPGVVIHANLVNGLRVKQF